MKKMHLNPANRGKFTATKKRTGKSTSELLHSSDALTRKRANFARMAKRHFQPLNKGGLVEPGYEDRMLRKCGIKCY